MINKQIGVTLIELLISMTLSLALIAGISSLFVQMQKSNKIQTAVTGIMDDSRYVQEVIQKEVRRTGGLRAPNDSNGRGSKVYLALNDPFPGSALDFLAPNIADPGLTKGEYVKGAKVGSNDEIIFRYQLVDKLDLSDADPANSSSPCTSGLVLGPNDDPAVNIYVVTLYMYVRNGSLMCQSRRDTIDPLNPGIYSAAAPNPVIQTETELVGNVQQMSVTYGVDSVSGDKISAATYYTSAATLDAAVAPSWVSVVSLRISLAMKSAEKNVVPTIMPYTIDGATVTPTDRNLYRVFTTTIALRNQLES